MNNNIKAHLKTLESEIDNEIEKNSGLGVSAKKLNNFLNEIYNFDNVLLTQDFDLEGLVEKLNTNSVYSIELSISENNVEVVIEFVFPSLKIFNRFSSGGEQGRQYAVLKILENSKNNFFSANFIRGDSEVLKEKSKEKIAYAGSELSEEQIFELMRPPEKIKIENFQDKIKSMTKLVEFRYEENVLDDIKEYLDNCAIGCWVGDELWHGGLDFLDDKISLNDLVFADLFFSKIIDLESKYGIENSVLILRNAANKLHTKATTLEFEKFLEPLNQSEKEFNAKKIIAEKNIKKIKSLKI